MPRYAAHDGEPRDDWIDHGSRLLNLIVRTAGLGLLGTGFVVALFVIGTAWSLFEDPGHIEAFAREIERGSNLDLTLSSAVSGARRQFDAPLGEDAAGQPAVDRGGDAAGPAVPQPVQPAFRFSYFVAWLIALLLLLLIGRLSLAAVRTGGELALYDVKVGKLARALLTERLRTSQG